MFGISKYLLGGAGIAIALVLVWAMRLDHLRAGWKEKFETLHEEASTVLIALRAAADNPKLEWKNAPGQIVALGESNKTLKGAIEDQNLRIDEMAREAVRLQARAAELKRIADRAQAQRQSALRKLSDMAITPGTREDCMTLLREAEEALDVVRGAGA